MFSLKTTVPIYWSVDVTSLRKIPQWRYIHIQFCYL